MQKQSMQLDEYRNLVLPDEAPIAGKSPAQVEQYVR